MKITTYRFLARNSIVDWFMQKIEKLRNIDTFHLELVVFISRPEFHQRRRTILTAEKKKKQYKHRFDYVIAEFHWHLMVSTLPTNRNLNWNLRWMRKRFSHKTGFVYRNYERVVRNIVVSWPNWKSAISTSSFIHRRWRINSKRKLSSSKHRSKRRERWVKSIKPSLETNEPE